MNYTYHYLNLALLFFFLLVSPAYTNANIDSLCLEVTKSCIDGDTIKAINQFKNYEEELTNYFYSNYDDHITELYQSYEIDQTELENQKSRNRLLKFILSCAFCLIFISVLINRRLKRKNKELKEYQKQLISAKKMAEFSIMNKSVMISNMSHEIRTPLNAIIGFSEILTLDDIEETYISQCHEIINQNSNLLLKLINDVIDVRSSEINTMTFTIQVCEIISLCKTIVKTLNRIKNSNVNIVFNSSIEELYIETDIERIQQIIFNLINNALKFCKEGKIMLSVNYRNKHELTFSVTDTGCGIPEEIQNKLFHRVEKFNENIKGTGLGLSICKIIIEKLNGSIYLDTDYNKGAKFIFTHPIKQIQK